MRIAVISDVHANIRRLDAVLEELEKEGIPSQDTFVLGDIVNDGVQIDEERCISRISKRNLRVLEGNHDRWVSIRYSIFKEPEARRRFNPPISQESIDYLSSLPKYIKRDNILFAHTLPIGGINRVENQRDAREVLEGLNGQGEGIDKTFIGHVSTPMTFEYDPSRRDCKSIQGSFETRPDRKYLIITGSLGERALGDYLIHDLETRKVERRNIR